MTGEGDTPTNHRRVAFQCVAYGNDLSGLCFCELSGNCATEADCDRRMAEQRMLLWVQLHARAAAGDELSASLLDEITGPDQLLGGPRSSESTEPPASS